MTYDTYYQLFVDGKSTFASVNLEKVREVRDAYHKMNSNITTEIKETTFDPANKL